MGSLFEIDNIVEGILKTKQNKQNSNITKITFKSEEAE